MNKKLLEMLNAVNKQRDNVRELFDAGKIDEAREAKNKLKDMQADFEKEINKDANSDILDDLDDTVITPAGVQQPKALNANDETKMFLNAVKHNFANDKTYPRPSIEEDGGVLIPKDISIKIEKYRDSKFSLDTLVSHETTDTSTGSRVVMDKANIEGFVNLDEEDEIAQIDNMKFSTVKYNIHDFAGFMPVHNNLLADAGSDVQLEKEIIAWFGDYSRVTHNKEIMKKLREGKTEQGQQEPTYKVINGMTDIGTIVNVTLGSTYKDDSVIITNDFGIDIMSQWKDANGRSLLQPMPNEPKQNRLCFGNVIIPVKTINTKDLPNITDKGKEYAPFIAGSLTDAIRIYDRKRMTMDSSREASIGKFNAYSKNMTLFRAIERFDTVLRDTDSYVLGRFGKELTAEILAAAKNVKPAKPAA